MDGPSIIVGVLVGAAAVIAGFSIGMMVDRRDRRRKNHRDRAIPKGTRGPGRPPATKKPVPPPGEILPIPGAGDIKDWPVGKGL